MCIYICIYIEAMLTLEENVQFESLKRQSLAYLREQGAKYRTQLQVRLLNALHTHRCVILNW